MRRVGSCHVFLCFCFFGICVFGSLYFSLLFVLGGSWCFFSGFRTPEKPRNKKKCIHRGGKMQRVGSCHVFFLVSFSVFLVPWFLVCSLFNRMAGKTSGQDLTLCRFEIA